MKKEKSIAPLIEIKGAMAFIEILGNGNNLAVRFRYRLGSRNCKLKAKGSTARRNLKDAGCQEGTWRANSRNDEQKPPKRPNWGERVSEMRFYNLPEKIPNSG